MKLYQIKSDSTKKFSLIFNDQLLGNLLYDNWFSLKSEIVLADNTTFRIEPADFWGTKIELKSNDLILLNFKLGWNGSIIIKTNFGGTDNEFIFKQKGLLKSNYVLLGKEQQEILIVQPDYKWSKLNYDYNISTSDSFDRFEHKELFLLSVIHCTNYYITMMTIAAI